MSTRQLKKLQKQQELARIQSLAENDHHDEASEDEVAPPKPRPSAFAGFAALQADQDDDQDEDDEQEPEPAPQPAAPAAPAKKSKKSKKKKKGKQAAAAGVLEDAEDKPRPRPGGLDEIDLALRELDMKPAGQTAADDEANTACDARLARLLSIDFHYLKIINEQRAIFGSDTIESVRRQDEARAREEERRRNRGARPQEVDLETFLKGRPGEKISDVILRRNPFILGQREWPRATAGGLKMEALTDPRVDPAEFTFTHDQQYQMQEMEFVNLVDMMDPMRIVYFLHDHPYHVNALVQTSKFARHQNQNGALARDLCERALFTFGRVTLSSFRKKLERGVVRLDFRRPENRQFWLAGHHYIQALSRQGTIITALEWSKLLLSLSLRDEYAVMNFIHVLAIRAQEPNWLLALCDSAYFTSDEYDVPMKDYYRQTCVLAKVQLNDREGALDDLVKGMETLPWLYSAVCSAINIDTPRAIWGVQPRDEKDTLYTELYIHMAKDLWKRYATDLLKEAGEKAQKVDVYGLPRASEIPLSIGRFVYLDNTPELMRHVPSSMLHADPNFDYDPLPPPLEENIFSSPFQSLPWRRARGEDVGSNSEGGGAGARAAGSRPELEEELARLAEEGIADAPEENQPLLYALARRFLPVRWLFGGSPPAEEHPDALAAALLEEEGENDAETASDDDRDDAQDHQPY